MPALCVALSSEPDGSLAQSAVGQAGRGASSQAGSRAAWRELAATAQGNAFGAAHPLPIRTAPTQLFSVSPPLANSDGGRRVRTEK